jgi:hypothetical protein
MDDYYKNKVQDILSERRQILEDAFRACGYGPIDEPPKPKSMLRRFVIIVLMLVFLFSMIAITAIVSTSPPNKTNSRQQTPHYYQLN